MGLRGREGEGEGVFFFVYRCFLGSGFGEGREGWEEEGGWKSRREDGVVDVKGRERRGKWGDRVKVAWMDDNNPDHQDIRCWHIRGLATGGKG